MQAPTEADGSRSHHGQILLEAAASLIDKRVDSLRAGVTPLHPIEELSLASLTIRKLAAELGKIYDARLGTQSGEPCATPASDVRAPPVLVRTKERHAA